MLYFEKNPFFYSFLISHLIEHQYFYYQEKRHLGSNCTLTCFLKCVKSSPQKTGEIPVFFVSLFLLLSCKIDNIYKIFTRFCSLNKILKNNSRAKSLVFILPFCNLSYLVSKLCFLKELPLYFMCKALRNSLQSDIYLLGLEYLFIR